MNSHLLQMYTFVLYYVKYRVLEKQRNRKQTPRIYQRNKNYSNRMKFLIQIKMK